MTISVRLAKAGACMASAAALSLLPMAHAQSFSPAKSNATLTVTYDFVSSGVERPKSNEKNVTWTVKNTFQTTSTLVAQKPTGFGVYHKPDAAEQAREADRQKNVTAASKDMQPMMNQAAKIAEICGDDEQCLMRETMKMAQGMDPSKMAAAKSKVDKATVLPADRYQTFSAGQTSGTFSIDEISHEAYFDAACSFRNEATCAIDQTVKGGGKLSDGSGKTSMQGTAMGEYDAQTGSLILTFPFAGVAKATKTTVSKSPDRESGSEEVIRTFNIPNTQDIRLTATCGACKTAEGTYTTAIDDQLLGRKGTLKVTWKFTRP